MILNVFVCYMLLNYACFNVVIMSHDVGAEGLKSVIILPRDTFSRFQHCGGSGSSLYRTLVAEVTFHRPCAPEECAWGALWLSQTSFPRTCVVNTVLARTLGRDSQLGAPCSGSGSSLHRTCVADVTFYRPCPPEECAWGALSPPGRVSHAPV